MTSSTDNSSAPDLREQLKSVPEAPGCYLWKNAQGEILYVGKAVDLRARMMQYVSGQDERLKIPFMMEQVASFDYIVVNNETESLVLEKNLIQQYNPPFNVDLSRQQELPVHCHHQERRISRHQVHAREAQERHTLFWALHRCTCGPRDHRYRATHRADLRRVLRAVSQDDAHDRGGQMAHVR